MGEMKLPKIETGHVDEMLSGSFEEKVEGLREMNERSLENLERTEELWIANLDRLKKSVPQNDVVIDSKTLSYNVLMCAWKAKLMELEGLREELEQAREQLDYVVLEQAN